MQSKAKRSVLPFVGSALSFLFGVVSEDQLGQIRNSINVLARNQHAVLHVVKESLTILNVSRVQISENRHAITGLIGALQQIQCKDKNISELREKQISQLEQFIDMYLKLDHRRTETNDTTRNVLIRKYKAAIESLEYGTSITIYHLA